MHVIVVLIQKSCLLRQLQVDHITIWGGWSWIWCFANRIVHFYALSQIPSLHLQRGPWLRWAVCHGRVTEWLWSWRLKSLSSISCVYEGYIGWLNVLIALFQIIVFTKVFKIWWPSFLMKDLNRNDFLSQWTLGVSHIFCCVVYRIVMHNLFRRRDSSSHAPKVCCIFVWSHMRFFCRRNLFNTLLAWYYWTLGNDWGRFRSRCTSS